MKFAASAVAGLAVAGLLATAALPAQARESEGQDDVSTRIIGGNEATQYYPWMASLGGCGGSLVAPQWVVTAAHCLSSANTVTFGDNRKSRHTERISVAQKFRGPNGMDIAMLKLASPSTMTPIVIAKDAPVGTKSRIIGWGSTIPTGGGYPDMLKELDTQIISADRCRSVGGSDAQLELCTDNPAGNQGACYGDSGGPQVTFANGRWELIGATSRGGDTCANAPSIYMNVPAFWDWINKTSGGEIPAPGGNGNINPNPNPNPHPTQPQPQPNPTQPQPNPNPQPTQPNPNPNPNARLIRVDISKAGDYADEMTEALKIWNSKVPTINLQPVTGGGVADVTVGTGPGWPYAQTFSLGRGHVHMGTKAMDDGHFALRVATHELGHIFGMPDRRTGKCDDLMSGSSAGITCKNPYPNAAEIEEVTRSFGRGYGPAESEYRIFDESALEAAVAE